MSSFVIECTTEHYHAGDGMFEIFIHDDGPLKVFHIKHNLHSYLTELFILSAKLFNISPEFSTRYYFSLYYPNSAMVIYNLIRQGSSSQQQHQPPACLQESLQR